MANNVTTADALPCMLDKKNIDLLEKFGILSEEELKSRYIISLEKYNKLINIESRLMHRMVKRTYLPAISEYCATVASQINDIKKANAGAKVRDLKETLNTLVKGIEFIHDCLENLDKLREQAKNISNEQKRANHNANKLIPAMKALRKSIDDMEHIVSRDY